MALSGVEAIGCEVEVDVASRGFANAAIVGLPDTGMNESLQRVQAVF
jgi:predicted ATPase with chaperone activity